MFLLLYPAFHTVHCFVLLIRTLPLYQLFLEDPICHPLNPINMAAVNFVTGYITNYVEGMVRPYVEQGAAAVGDVAGGVLFTVCASSKYE